MKRLIVSIDCHVVYVRGQVSGLECEEKPLIAPVEICVARGQGSDEHAYIN